MDAHILSWIIFTPFIGAALILCLPKSMHSNAKWIATGTTSVAALLTFRALSLFEKGVGTFQLTEKVSWIPQFNVSYFLGVDGISLPMIILTSVVTLLACIASFGIKERQKEYFFLFLLLEGSILGTFLSLDLFLFYIFWEIVLVPMYFLIGIWGGPRKEYASIKFFLYTLAGSLFMLLGILAIYFASPVQTFDVTVLAKNNFDFGFQKWVFLAMFLGFAVKVPCFPFHTWLPDAHVEAPTPISVILAGVLLKMGTYGFLRFSYPILPQGAQWFAPAMAILAVIGIVYGGFCALAQTDFKKMVAYSSVSHMGFAVLGLAALNVNGLNGTMLQMFTHGTITGGLFLLVGVLYDRSHTRDMNAFGGLASHLPLYSGILIFFAMASLGLPGLSGFVAEFLVLLGGYEFNRLYTGLACIGIILAASYLLIMVKKVLLGPFNEKWKELKEINARELLTIVPLMILVVLVGVYPRIVLDYVTPTIELLVKQMGGAVS